MCGREAVGEEQRQAMVLDRFMTKQGPARSWREGGSRQNREFCHFELEEKKGEIRGGRPREEQVQGVNFLYTGTSAYEQMAPIIMDQKKVEKWAEWSRSGQNRVEEGKRRGTWTAGGEIYKIVTL